VPVDGAVRNVVALARRQHAVIRLGQLEEAGLGRHAVAHRVKSGWLQPLHRGVYLVGPLETEHSRAMAATLAAGPDAVLSHYPAAVLWCLRPPVDGPMHVTIPGRNARSRPGITIHRATLLPADITRRHGIPVTSAARALLDLAATAPTPELERALNEAEVHRRVSTHSLNAQFQRYPRHRGIRALRDLVDHEPKLTRSDAEILMLTLIRKARLPEPESNVKLAGYEVDLRWRDHNLVVEFDSYTFHSSRQAFERDRRKDRELQALGYRVLRFTWRGLTKEREAVVAALSRALAERR
jgi:very-short-patch-repair endonuclease